MKHICPDIIHVVNDISQLRDKLSHFDTHRNVVFVQIYHYWSVKVNALPSIVNLLA